MELKQGIAADADAAAAGVSMAPGLIMFVRIPFACEVRCPCTHE
jgi:hypothetical protein